MLAQSLEKMAKQGQRAIVVSIHQPRAEIFDALDNLLLLGAGGSVIFFGVSTSNLPLLVISRCFLTDCL